MLVWFGFSLVRVLGEADFKESASLFFLGKKFEKSFDERLGGWYLVLTMKFKMFVCVDGHKSLIASTNNFSDFQNLIEELERFGTQWEATEDGVTVFTTILS